MVVSYCPDNLVHATVEKGKFVAAKTENLLKESFIEEGEISAFSYFTRHDLFDDETYFNDLEVLDLSPINKFIGTCKDASGFYVT